jgi:hypothetical protein
MWKSILNFHQEKCQAKENSIYKIVENESIVYKYLVEMSTSATSSNFACVGNNGENPTSHTKSKQEGCTKSTIEHNNDEKETIREEKCLMAKASDEVRSETK